MKNKKNWKEFRTTIILTSLITMIPVLIGVILWSQLPDTIATHFGTDNVPNGWSSKPFTVFGLPGILLLVQWVCAFAILNDPKKKNISNKILGLILWIVPVVSLIICAQIYAIALGYQVDIGLFTNLIIGILFVAIGNYLPKCKQNYTVGIRLPWTLSSEENWNRTHRFASWIWILGGVVFILNAFWQSEWILAIIIVLVVLPTAYSFLLYRKGI
ncbi:Immunity protein SdpI [Clostridiales bacterium CHKCI001]|nr:Immunity protein SdpI [Clostridiales bacterium CHKCI001]